MTVTSAQLNGPQYAATNTSAPFNNQSIRKIVREIVLERSENEEDYRDAVAAKKVSNGEVVSREEMLKELGLD
jgi:hypothetical protein